MTYLLLTLPFFLHLVNTITLHPVACSIYFISPSYSHSYSTPSLINPFIPYPFPISFIDSSYRNNSCTHSFPLTLPFPSFHIPFQFIPSVRLSHSSPISFFSFIPFLPHPFPISFICASYCHSSPHSSISFIPFVPLRNKAI